jgi:hypothetical protein
LNLETRCDNIYLVEKKPHNSPGELRSAFPQRRVCVCDFRIDGSEMGRIGENGATEYDGLLIIDHHIPIPQMQRQISSTIIAVAYVRQHGPLGAEWAIVINHTDADSILSALVMAGRLAAEDDWGAAAVAADHSGAENLLGDVLQALEDDRELEKSIVVALELSADAGSLAEMADVRQKVQKRQAVRQVLREQVEKGAFHWHGEIAWIVLDEKIDAGLAPALLPDAGVIVIASPMPAGSPKPWRIRTRLGMGIEGIDLSQLGLPDSGGRWNAVSTSRHGGTNIEPQTYVSILADKLARR